MRIKSIHNTKIKTKLIALGATGIIGLALVGGISIVTAKQINQASTDITQEWLPSVIIAEELNTATSDYRIKEYYHVITNDPDIKANLEIEMKRLRDGIDQNFASYEPYVTNETDRQMMNQAKDLWRDYLKYSDSLLAVSRDGGPTQATDLIVGESRKLFNEASNLFLDVVNFNKEGAEQASIHGDQLYARLTKLKVVLVCLIGAVIFIMVVYIIRAIEKPVEEIVDGVRRVSNGDLDVHLNYRSEDEIGILTESVNALITRLRDIIRDERYMFEEIGNENFSVKSSCQQAYRGDFAPILYSIESLKSRLEDAKYHPENRKKEKQPAGRRAGELKKKPVEPEKPEVVPEVKLRELKKKENE